MLLYSHKFQEGLGANEILEILKFCAHTYLNTSALKKRKRPSPDFPGNAMKGSLQTTLMINFHVEPTFIKHLGS